MRIMSKPHALHACTVTRAKALAGSTNGIRDYLYPPFAQLVISSSRSVYNTTCFIALVFHSHNSMRLKLLIRLIRALYALDLKVVSKLGYKSLSFI